MKREILTITGNQSLTRDVFEMRLRGDVRAVARPGQFVNIALDGLFLRRPISVCDWSAEALTLIYKVVGKGTLQMSQMQAGEKLDVLVGLGNGFDLSLCPDDPVLIGGGVGVPPMYGLAKRLIAQGKHPSVILGFNKKEEIFYAGTFASLGVEVIVTTVDGSAGVKGFVTDALRENAYVCCCGPEPMLKAVYNRAAGGQFSFEARMGCGFGACMGCSCKTQYGNKRICKDGPVLTKEEIIW